jgi:hypothetical protein
MVIPCGEKAQPVIECVWPESVPISCQVIASHNFKVVSRDADTNILPSRENAHVVTELACPVNVRNN